MTSTLRPGTRTSRTGKATVNIRFRRGPRNVKLSALDLLRTWGPGGRGLA